MTSKQCIRTESDLDPINFRVNDLLVRPLGRAVQPLVVKYFNRYILAKNCYMKYEKIGIYILNNVI